MFHPAKLDRLTMDFKITQAGSIKDPVKDKLKRFGLFAQFGETRFFPTIDAAVSRYLATHEIGQESQRAAT
jgi:hypothetical protein